MSSIQVAPLPAGAFLERYRAAGDYTDCYTVAFSGSASLSEYMAAFYTTPVFKLERRLLSIFLRFPSTDQEAKLLAQGEVNSFSAWRVESREARQAILAAGRTRSWLMVSPHAAGSQTTNLFFGSAVLQRRRGGLGWAFSALLGFHKLYSRILLASAVRRLSRTQKS
jgi:hypothetical protein